ncbi:hypothetical protein K469DRAFT_792419 [Zopfia rhizophila CBS 207.26]|uniref:Uncharacterized protein n=1 Tax=Zopfia rhizophila CBS 207.26 TaxID=1314779 RepID=A0A6A6DPC3_9PEZI|nr:hypothetical protein K469DRAFT_792419 [Zopfia rhizophila CBS 207.26]
MHLTMKTIVSFQIEAKRHYCKPIMRPWIHFLQHHQPHIQQYKARMHFWSLNLRSQLKGTNVRIWKLHRRPWQRISVVREKVRMITRRRRICCPSMSCWG